MFRVALLCSFLTLTLFGFGATVSVRLYIREGALSLVDGSSIPYLVYTTESTFQKNSELFIWQTGDLVDLEVFNEDTLSHGFLIDGLTDLGTILPGDSAQSTITLSSAGVYRYYDPLNYPFNAYMGLAGIVHVKDASDNLPYFYWDLREHQTSWNSLIPNGATPSLSTYDPFYFTINGNSEPDINLDPIARVTGNVGQELRIIIVNNGISIHSMHFHGYHSTLLVNSKDPSHQGRSKDTFPLYPSEFVVLSLTPDKPGEYPVHDHNLVAVTGGGVYHAGMFTTLLIAP